MRTSLRKGAKRCAARRCGLEAETGDEGLGGADAKRRARRNSGAKMAGVRRHQPIWAGPQGRDEDGNVGLVADEVIGEHESKNSMPSQDEQGARSTPRYKERLKKNPRVEEQPGRGASSGARHGSRESVAPEPSTNSSGPALE